MSDHKQFIGDAVYADFDGYHIVLTTSDGLRDTNKIYLEPSVFSALLSWREALIKEFNRGQESEESQGKETDEEASSPHIQGEAEGPA